MKVVPTIAALASGQVGAALAVIRVSGPLAWCAAAACLDKKEAFSRAAPRTVGLYFFKAPGNDARLDQVTAIKYRAPASFTGEDMVEIFCHGSMLIARKIVAGLYKCGCIPAARGEFSRRAFLNNKISLLQAEAVNEIILSKTEDSLKNALVQYRGGYVPVLNRWKQELKEILEKLEGSIEFSEEDDFSKANINRLLFNKINKLQQEIKQEINKKTLIHGVDNNFAIAIIGVPNVGKSSLFNELLQFERAIVHHKAGTTRDTISETIYLDNIPVTLIDTAGITCTKNAVEKIGIQRTKNIIKCADLVIMVTSANTKTTKQEATIIDDIIKAGIPIIGIINKTDLCSPKDKAGLFGEKVPCFSVSLKTKPIDIRLFRFILKFSKPYIQKEFVPSIIQNSRHEHIARKLLEELTGAHKEKKREEVVAFYIKNALELIAEFLGTTTSQEVLDSIFQKFCIGK
ncbi:MAG: tRNA uridine-5-carboxymethylaminomethyl(34) synthesis GTPase MnmE [Chitinivibrionales bacterium]|nr:tRNA uridine-5-carboxymethylaminomethyl(34) synthesis GTPase MnmE [Chitinivibrionales bacterium]